MNTRTHTTQSIVELYVLGSNIICTRQTSRCRLRHVKSRSDKHSYANKDPAKHQHYLVSSIWLTSSLLSSISPLRQFTHCVTYSVCYHLLPDNVCKENEAKQPKGRVARTKHERHIHIHCFENKPKQIEEIRRHADKRIEIWWAQCPINIKSLFFIHFLPFFRSRTTGSLLIVTRDALNIPTTSCSRCDRFFRINGS